MSTLEFDPEKAHKAKKALYKVLIAMSDDVERPLRRITLPEMPAATRGEVSALISSAIATMADARVGVAGVAVALHDKSQAMGVYDRVAKVKNPWWVGVGDGVMKVNKFMGTDLIYTTIGGVDMSHPLHPDFQLSHASFKERVGSVASFGANFIPVGKIGGAGLRGVEKLGVGGRFIGAGIRGAGRVGAAGARGASSAARGAGRFAVSGVESGVRGAGGLLRRGISGATSRLSRDSVEATVREMDEAGARAFNALEHRYGGQLMGSGLDAAEHGAGHVRPQLSFWDRPSAAAGLGPVREAEAWRAAEGAAFHTEFGSALAHSGGVGRQIAGVASEVGGTQIEGTFSGAVMDRQGLFNSTATWRARAVWRHASGEFIAQASGPLRAVVGDGWLKAVAESGGKSVAETDFVGEATRRSIFLSTEIPGALGNAYIPSLTVERFGVGSRLPAIERELSRSDPNAGRHVLEELLKYPNHPVRFRFIP